MAYTKRKSAVKNIKKINRVKNVLETIGKAGSRLNLCINADIPPSLNYGSGSLQTIFMV
jgi:hypothetical protein